MSIRHFGIDIHKNFVMVAAVNNKQETVQQPMRVEMFCRNGLNKRSHPKTAV